MVIVLSQASYEYNPIVEKLIFFKKKFLIRKVISESNQEGKNV